MNINEIDSILNHRDFAPSDQTRMMEFKTDSGYTSKPFNEHSIDSNSVDKYKLYRFDPEVGIELFPFFNLHPPEGVRAICDYFIFAEYNAYLYIILIELKTGHQSATVQLEASKCFINYILETAKRIGMDVSNVRQLFVKLLPSKKTTTKLAKPVIKDGNIIHYDWSKFRLLSIFKTN